jgi:hypothetical protein
MYQGKYDNLDLRYQSFPTGTNGSTCNTPASPAKQNVGYSARGRKCTPNDPGYANCLGSACMPTSLPSTFSVCFRAPGRQFCPSFDLSAHDVGTDVTYSCTDCGCTQSNVTCGGSVVLFSDTTCMANPLFVAADNMCHPSGATQGLTYQSFNFVGNVVDKSCLPGNFTEATGLTLTNEETICCY